MSPSNRDGLQPLLIPLACHQSPADTDDEVYTCFLRWPDLSSSRVRSRYFYPTLSADNFNGLTCLPVYGEFYLT